MIIFVSPHLCGVSINSSSRWPSTSSFVHFQKFMVGALGKSLGNLPSRISRKDEIMIKVWNSAGWLARRNGDSDMTSSVGSAALMLSRMPKRGCRRTCCTKDVCCVVADVVAVFVRILVLFGTGEFLAGTKAQDWCVFGARRATMPTTTTTTTNPNRVILAVRWSTQPKHRRLWVRT